MSSPAYRAGRVVAPLDSTHHDLVVDVDEPRRLLVRAPRPFQTEPVGRDYWRRYWTPVLGPTATLLAEAVVRHRGDVLSLRDLGAIIGVTKRDPIVGAWLRLRRHHLGWDDEAGATRSVVAAAPRLSATQLGHLPAVLVEVERQTPSGGIPAPPPPTRRGVG